jgi:hypothetical protein
MKSGGNAPETISNLKVEIMAADTTPIFATGSRDDTESKLGAFEASDGLNA